MRQEEFRTMVLHAEEGKYLTQAGDVDVMERLVASVVALGRWDSSENWREITAEEAEEIRAAKEAALEATGAEAPGPEQKGYADMAGAEAPGPEQKGYADMAGAEAPGPEQKGYAAGGAEAPGPEQKEEA